MSKTTKLKNVRLSFPSIFQKADYNGESTGKYEATFLIPKDREDIKEMLDKAIEAKIKEAKIKVKSENLCLKDGDEAEWDGYEGNWSLKASSNKRFTILDAEGVPSVEEDELFYAGCRVHAIVDFWVQNNQWGKRVNANLLGIKFFEDDEPFGSGPIDVTDEFDEFDDEDDM